MEKIEEQMIEILRSVKNTLEDKNITFWLDFGTLLGAIREGEFIKWDHDIDIGTWATNIEKVCSLSEEFEKNGFVTTLTSNHRMLVGKDINGKRVNLDILMYHVKGDKASLSGKIIHKPAEYFAWILKPPKRKEIEKSKFFTKSFAKTSSLFSKGLRRFFYKILWIVPKKLGYLRHMEREAKKSFFENLKDIKFYDMKFKIPEKTEEYLCFRYGKKWKKPIDEETFYKDLDSMGGE